MLHIHLSIKILTNIRMKEFQTKCHQNWTIAPEFRILGGREEEGRGISNIFFIKIEKTK